MLSAFEYFPTIVYRDERPEWVESSLSASKRYFDAYQGTGFLCQTDHMGNDHEFQFLVNYLLYSARSVLGQQGYAIDRYDLYVSGLWGQEVKGVGGTDVHVHKNSQICGWYFLEVSQGGAYPMYYDTRMNKQMIELDTAPSSVVLNATPTVHFNNVAPGTVLFSNSWMQHRLGNGAENGHTKSIHFIVSHKDTQCNI